MATRNGKIADLPNDIREQLNLRLLEGETGRELAAWLNALPAVQSILGSQFNGSPISKVNITHWRQGGYLQWVTERECFDSARALADADGDLATTGLAAERLLNILTLRFGQLLMRWDLPSDETISETAAEPIGVGAGGRSRKEASPFAEMARKARILQGISRSVLAIHRIQSQSPRKKSEPATSSANSHASPDRDAQSTPSAPGKTAESRDREALPQSPKKGEPIRKNVSGPTTPSIPLNHSRTPFKTDPDLSEVLQAG
jgi:hypothetical protein